MASPKRKLVDVTKRDALYARVRRLVGGKRVDCVTVWDNCALVEFGSRWVLVAIKDGRFETVKLGDSVGWRVASKLIQRYDEAL